jgi:hypothetical protein
MVWPNRGAIGLITGYGLNVLNLLQDSHRSCRYAPAAASRRLARYSGKPKRHRPYSLSRPRRPVFLLAARPQGGRAGRQVQKDPRASTPRDIEACRSPVPRLALWFERSAKRAASPPNPGRPARGVYRFAPHRPRWSHFSRVMPVGAAPRLPTDEARHSAGVLLTGLPGLPAVRDLGAQTRRAGSDAAWTAGPSHRISDARS